MAREGQKLSRLGTAVSRLRTSAETVSLVVTLMAPGCPLQAMVGAFGFDERTVAGWLVRAGVQGQAVPAHLVEQPHDLGPVQADEIRMQTQGGRVWMALARMVRTRLWLAGEVSAQRDMPRLRRLIERGRRCAAHRPRVVDVERRMVDGTPARVETRRQRSHGDGVLNPADIERLNATFRARLASLTRRGWALPRCPLTLHHGMYLIGTVDNFCTPHASLSRVGRATTPAMATGITDYCWNVRELLSYHVPPPRWTPPKPRGRLSHALKCLMERWCGDHG